MKKIIFSVIAVVMLSAASVDARVPAKKGTQKARTAQTRKTSNTAKKKTAVTTLKSNKPADDAMVNNEDVMIEMQTSMGPIEILLYGDTPLHRDNFVKNVKEGIYDGLLFHRVIKDFMVQGGDPDSRDAAPGKMLGGGDLGYTIPAEIVYPKHYHKYGALAAARTGDEVNPEHRSSASQFYIVTGKKYDEATLQRMQEQSVQKQQQTYFNSLVMERQEEIKKLMDAQDQAALDALQQELVQKTLNDFKPSVMTEEMLNTYQTVGGTPFLDTQYTVYGEVVKGMDVVEKIQNASTGNADRPVEDIKIISVKVK